MEARDRGATPDPTNDPPDATVILGRLAAGDDAAADELLPLVYDELRVIARRHFRGQRSDHTLQPTALVHEAFLKLVRSERQDWQNRRHFCVVASKAMRQILLNHAAAKRAIKRGGADARRIDVDVDQMTTPSGERSMDVVELDDALSRLAELNERQARVIELWFFGGLTVEQVAEALDISSRTVERDWRAARAWLTARLEGEVADG